jgi:hypothetical protein
MMIPDTLTQRGVLGGRSLVSLFEFGNLLTLESSSLLYHRLVQN